MEEEESEKTKIWQGLVSTQKEPLVKTPEFVVVKTPAQSEESPRARPRRTQRGTTVDPTTHESVATRASRSRRTGRGVTVAPMYVAEIKVSFVC